MTMKLTSMGTTFLNGFRWTLAAEVTTKTTPNNELQASSFVCDYFVTSLSFHEMGTSKSLQIPFMKETFVQTLWLGKIAWKQAKQISPRNATLQSDDGDDEDDDDFTPWTILWPFFSFHSLSMNGKKKKTSGIRNAWVGWWHMSGMILFDPFLISLQAWSYLFWKATPWTRVLGCKIGSLLLESTVGFSWQAVNGSIANPTLTVLQIP